MLLSSGWFYFTTILVTTMAFTVDIGVNKLLTYFGILKDGKSIKPHKIDEHLRESIVQTNIALEKKMQIKCNYLILFILDYGEAFSGDIGQAPSLLKKVTI